MKKPNHLLSITIAFGFGFLSAGRAAAADDEAARNRGWNTPYALLFSLQNIFDNPSILSGYGAGIGGQIHLSPTTALRVAADISRSSNPVYERETTQTGGTPTKELVIPAGPTSQLGLGLGADYLIRLSTRSLAPYVGAGVGLSWTNSSRSYTDDVNVPNVTTEVDNSTNSFGIGLRGLIGIGWRVHEWMSLYAEYGLSMGLLDRTSMSEKTTVTTAGGVNETTEKAAYTRYLNFDVSLVQGGSLGLVAFF